MRTLLIDADTLVYEAAKANETAMQFGADEWVSTGNMAGGMSQFDSAVAFLKEALGADEIVMTLSDYVNPWRKVIMPTYKAHRSGPKPVLFKALREYCHEKYRTFQRPGLEGDDVLGILTTNRTIITGEKVVVSIDKDMQSLPGLHANITQVRLGNSSLRSITVHEADAFHMRQTLTGDTTDGYPGCPGVGPKSCEKLLSPLWSVATDTFDVKAAWACIVAAYAKKGLSEEVALTNARVARICRNADYDFNTKAVILWNAPS